MRLSTLLSSLSLTLVLLFLNCTVPAVLEKDQLQNAISPLVIPECPSAVKGAGFASIRMQRRTYNGDMTVVWEKDSIFRADFYSPIGSIVATISGDSSEARFDYGDNRYVFPVLSTMDSLPFAWGKDFTFNEFSALITGNLSQFARILRTVPSAVADSGKKTLATWEVDGKNQIIQLEINRKKVIVEKLYLRSSADSFGWKMIFKNFKEGKPYSILFKEDANNYFSIDYTTLQFLTD